MSILRGHLRVYIRAQRSKCLNPNCKVFDEQRKLYGMTEQTVKETIRICKDRNIFLLQVPKA